MPTSEKITIRHLSRKAIIYVRQSSPNQVLTHQESSRLQYALRQRALNLGWRTDDIEVLDGDSGRTAAIPQSRDTFKELAAKVALGQVGIIFSTEVTRLSRNCSDWYPLLDVCGYQACLIADGDGIYDPGTINDRLLLGLKGTLSEMELHLIRTRMRTALLNKAERGELALQLPIGLVRDQLGRVEKNPNREVQQRIQLVFETFLEQRTASKVLKYLNQQNLSLPRRDRFGDLSWLPPSINAIIAILKNPAYAGAFVYGRTATAPRTPSAPRQTVKRLPIEEWKIRLNDKYPPYISWKNFEKIQAMLRDNHAEYERKKTRGVPRAGQSLLQGILYCGACGHKMLVEYRHGIQYLCAYIQLKHGGSRCQIMAANSIDHAVVEAFFQAISPVEVDLYSAALARHQQDEERARLACEQQLQRLRYEAEIARRQFNRVDPDNRLVASELEARWEAALRELKQAETLAEPASQEHISSFSLSPELRAALTSIGESLPRIWEQDLLSFEQKKALLRSLIEKVVLHRSAPDRAQIRIVWIGGETTTLAAPLLVNNFASLSTAGEMEKLIVKLATDGVCDEEIAEQLTEQGHRSPRQRIVLPSTVKTIRLKNGILQRKQSHPREIEGFLTVPQLAEALKVSVQYIYDRIHNGTIEIAKDTATGLYLFPNQPTTIKQFKQLIAGRFQNLRF
ncbi:MAG: recombinase family protein [Acidobacteria bacterium]|nr:recombinase family protein [Acidobacteriota bacterium]